MARPQAIVIKSSHAPDDGYAKFPRMSDTMTQRPWIRMRDARPLFEWYTRHAVQHCALVLSLVPEDMLADRDQLSACLTEELDDLSRRLADYLETQWQSAWEKAMAGKFIDLPNLQN